MARPRRPLSSFLRCLKRHYKARNRNSTRRLCLMCDGGVLDCVAGIQPLQGRRGAPGRAGAAVGWDKRRMSVTSGTKRKEGGLSETIRVIFHALVIALVIRTFLFQPFNIPSGSMKATLLVGDYLFVSKYTYGYSQFSLPLSPPLFSGRIPSGWLPARGDVVVFRLPKDTSTDYIKRVIGLPGDKIQVIDGQVHINGVPVKREPATPFIETEEVARATPVKRWKETLDNGVSHYTLDLVDNGFADNTQVYTE